jgi:pyridoxamine 5'-phosphate oxidase family protein
MVEVVDWGRSLHHNGERPTTVSFTDAELSYLATQRIGRLATARPDGTLQVNPVSFGYNAELGTIDIGGYNMAASRKFRNVAAGSRVAFVVDDMPSTDPVRVRMVEIRGDAEALADPADGRAQIGGPIIRIHPRRIISIGLEPGDADREPHTLKGFSRNV